MALDFNLLRPTDGPNPVNAFFQGQQEAARNALAQEQAGMAREQAAMAREQNALRRQQTELGMQATRAQMANVEEDRAKARRLERAAMFRERLLRAPTPEAAREIVKMQYADPELGQVLSQAGTLEQALAQVPDDPNQFETYRQQEVMGMSEWMKSQMPKVVGNAIYLPGERKFVSAPTQRLVSVIGPDGRPTMVPADQAAGMTPLTAATAKMAGIGAAPAPARAAKAEAPETGGLSPKDLQKREAAFPQATQAIRGFETKSEQFIKELEKLRDDPGLNQITGPIFGRTPSVSREGSRAQALYDKIFAKGGFQALQDMREASKTGGALGNVSNEEGRRLEKSIVGGLDRTQNIKDVQQGINDLIEEIRTSQARVRDAYDMTYEYRANRQAPATPARLSPQDQEALKWANANPKDPRAAAIKQQLGVK